MSGERKKKESTLQKENEELKKRVKELEQDHFLFSALLDNIPDTIYFKDKESRFIRTSKSMALSLNRKSEQSLLGKTDFDIHDKEHAQQAFKDEQQIMATGNPIINCEQKELGTNNVEIWKSTTKLPLKDTKGNIIGTFGISRNITSRKKAEKESEFTKLCLNNINEEVKDPLRVILRLTSTLLSKDISDHQRQVYLRIIKNSGYNLNVTLQESIGP